MSRASAPTPPFCPYKGLSPYEDKDAAFFFGREVEINLIMANLRASRLTVLYGASGVGKTSVLKAGVAHELRGLSRENLEELGSPELAVVVFSDWRGDPSAGLLRAVHDSVEWSLGKDGTEAAVPSSLGWIESLRESTARLGGKLLVIFDQFDDYLLHPSHTDGSFAVDFPRAVNMPELRVNFLISIREDALAHLDRFKGPIPNLFNNSLRLSRLDRQAAREAIEKPLAEYNRQHGSDVRPDPGLVETVLDGAVTRDEPREQAGIETPFLQLVMTRLWDVERKAGSELLRLRTLKRLGGVEKIVRSHLDTALQILSIRARKLVVRIFDHLVTPSGAKQAQTVSDLAEWAGSSTAQMRRLVEELASEKIRVLRPLGAPADQPDLAQYEIFHDVLGVPIVEWRRRLKARSRIRKVVAVAAGVLAVMALVFSLLLLEAKRRVEELRSTSILLTANRVEDPLVQALLLTELEPADEPPHGLRIARRVASAAIPRVALHGHEGKVRSVAFDPGGRKILTGSADGTARIWNLDGSAEPSVLGGHRGVVYSAAFNSDGRRIVTGSADAMARVWNVDGSVEPVLLQGHGAAVLSVAFDPGGGRVVTGSADGTVRLWNVDGSGGTSVPFAEIGGWVWSVTFSPDGMQVAAGSSGGIARIWNLDGSGTPRTCDHEERVLSVAFDPEGERIVTGSTDGKARIWKADCSGALEIFSHEGEVASAAFDPAGGRIVTASIDGTARVWNADGSGDPVVFRHGAEVGSAAFGPDGRTIVTGSADGTVRIWDAEGPGSPLKLEVPGDGIWALAYSPDGERIITLSDDGKVRILSAEGSVTIELGVNVEGGMGMNAAFSPDGRRLFSPTDEGVWVSSVGASERLELGSGEGIEVSAFSPDGRRVVTGSEDGRVQVWRLDVPGPPLELGRHRAGVLSAAYSPDGQWLATGSVDGTVRIWREGRAPAPVLTEYGSEILTIAFSYDSRRIVTGSADGRVQVWPVGGQEPLLEIGRHRAEVLSAAFSPDGERIATGSTDGTVRIWRADRREPPVELADHRYQVRGVAFSPDGERLVTGSADGVVRIWRVSWPGLLAYLKEATTACLTIEQRTNYLAEALPDARSAHEACERGHGRTPQP